MKILISGGTGLIGNAVTQLLQKNRHQVHILTRNKNLITFPQHVFWDPDKGELNADELEGFDAIIHLAGANVSNGRWSESRKKIIIDSRVNSGNLLVERLREVKNPPKIFLSASGTGFYGSTESAELKDENSPPGDDFLAKCCVDWENSVKNVEGIGVKLAIIRTGVVLSKKGGALPKIAAPIRQFIGTVIGSGKQYMPWIHINDICRIYLHCIDNQLIGVFNGVAPNSVSNAKFTKKLAMVLKRKLWLPNAPSFVLKLFLGEMANIVLKGQNVSSKKIEESGFKFEFDTLESALEDFYK